MQAGGLEVAAGTGDHRVPFVVPGDHGEVVLLSVVVDDGDGAAGFGDHCSSPDRTTEVWAREPVCPLGFAVVVMASSVRVATDTAPGSNGQEGGAYLLDPCAYRADARPKLHRPGGAVFIERGVARHEVVLGLRVFPAVRG